MRLEPNQTRRLKINLSVAAWAQVERFAEQMECSTDAVVATFAECFAENHARQLLADMVPGRLRQILAGASLPIIHDV